MFSVFVSVASSSLIAVIDCCNVGISDTNCNNCKTDISSWFVIGGAVCTLGTEDISGLVASSAKGSIELSYSLNWISSPLNGSVGI